MFEHTNVERADAGFAGLNATKCSPEARGETHSKKTEDHSLNLRSGQRTPRKRFGRETIHDCALDCAKEAGQG